MVRILLFVVLFFVSCSFDGGEWNRHYDYAKNELTPSLYIDASCPEPKRKKGDKKYDDYGVYIIHPSHPYDMYDKFYSFYADGRVERMSESRAINYATEKACYYFYKRHPRYFKDKIKK